MSLPNPGMDFTPFDPLTAAEMDDLVENIEALAAGTGLNDGAIASAKLAQAFFRGRYQSDTTNSTPTGLTVQFGWGWQLGSAAAQIEETVTFPTAFSAAPIVMVSSLGQHTADPTAISDFVTNSGSYTQVNDITSSTFKAVTLSRDGASNLSATTRYGYSWIAIGTV